MPITTTTHLNFRGDARAALEFYQSVFGGEVAAFTYAEAHNVQDPSEADRIMWGQIRSDHGLQLMAYDVPVRMPYDHGVNSVFVSVRGTEAAEITAYWSGLCEGGRSSSISAPPAGRRSTAWSGTGSTWSGCWISSPTTPLADRVVASWPRCHAALKESGDGRARSDGVAVRAAAADR